MPSANRLTHCKTCGKKLEYWQRRVCSQNCHNADAKKCRQAPKRKEAEKLKAVRKDCLPIKPWKPKPKPKPILTDAQQAKIDAAIKAKHKLEFHAKIYQPGTPEFDEIAKKVTPIERIPRYRNIATKVNEDYTRS